MKPSQEYHDLIDSYKVLHQEEGKFKGISLVPLVPTLMSLIKENDCKLYLIMVVVKLYLMIKIDVKK